MPRLNDSPPAARSRLLYGGFLVPGVALLMVGVCVFSLFASQRLQRELLGSPLFPVPTRTASPVPLETLPMLDLDNSTLSGLAMVSADDGWIVGEDSGYALMLRYQGGHWLPQRDTVAHGWLQAVTFADGQHGWAVGSHAVDGVAGAATSTPGTLASEGLILHYQDGKWARVKPSITIVGTLTKIRLVAADDWWAINYQGEAGALNLVHYRRGVWSLVPLPPQVTDAHGLAVAGPDDVWVGVAGGVLHVHGGVSDQTPQSINGNLLALDLHGARDGWAAGLTFCGGSLSPACDQRVALYHYDGATWTPVATEARGELDAVAMTSDGGVWAVGSAMSKSRRSSLILRYQSGSWRQFPTTFAIDLSGLSMASSAEGWAIGYAQAPDGTHNAPGLLHYREGVWAEAHVG